MKFADLVFLIVLLGIVGALGRLAYCALRHRWSDVRRIGGRLLVFIVLYLGIVIGVAVATPRHWVAIGEEQRFDDWCVAVLSVDHHERNYRVVIRVSNQGRGRAQAAADAQLLLVADDGRKFAPKEDPDQRSPRSRLQAGEFFETICSYDVPDDARIVGIDVVHGAWPELFIVGDRGSLFHQRPLVRVE